MFFFFHNTLAIALHFAELFSQSLAECDNHLISDLGSIDIIKLILCY